MLPLLLLPLNAEEDSDNDDEKVSDLHPTWFGETEAAATRTAISILRVGAPEAMIKLAQLSVDDAVYALHLLAPAPALPLPLAGDADRFSSRSCSKRQHSTVSRCRPSVRALTSCCADHRIKAAVDKMAKHQKAWGALHFTRKKTDASLVGPPGYKPWARGSDKKNQQE
jgi:hypothetical protein